MRFKTFRARQSIPTWKEGSGVDRIKILVRVESNPLASDNFIDHCAELPDVGLHEKPAWLTVRVVSQDISFGKVAGLQGQA